MALESSLLKAALEVAVVLWVERVRPNLDEEICDRERLVQSITEHGDILQFGGARKKGEVAAVFNDLAKALAILSFCPGGVTFAGLHFESTR